MLSFIIIPESAMIPVADSIHQVVRRMGIGKGLVMWSISKGWSWVRLHRKYEESNTISQISNNRMNGVVEIRLHYRYAGYDRHCQQRSIVTRGGLISDGRMAPGAGRKNRFSTGS